MEASQNKSEYMRKYMAERYKKDPLRASQQRNSNHIKSKHNISPEECDLYKHYLADVYKIKELIKRIPNELLIKILKDHNDEIHL